MGYSHQQKARQRKVIYLALILALFTGSLLHRRFVVERQAEDLQLREVSRGEVELTSSAVRLSLTGSRGLATTILWSAAIDKQARHEWNELELLVGSITKLQPYFITPWLFQSWNMAFNVAVESDRPRDKYYYVARGLELLAEGERRNQGTADDAVAGSRPKFPGHPELRHHMGFTYQLKIGNSDEKQTMRSLLDLSMIDPLKRDPEKFWTTDKNGRRVVKLDELARFTQDHPRLVRRLRENLGYNTPEQIVGFLAANKDVPSRFKRATSPDQRESELETPRRQFPILPPMAKRNWPDPKSYNLTRETPDVFLIGRTWYQYAQEPLPPPNPDPGVAEKEAEWQKKFDKLRYRGPKAMAIQIFRSYPSRAQVYIAETLEDEGWFDGDGWLVKDWFDQPGGEKREVRVGTEAKYHAGPAWQQGYEMYKEYGIENGLYLTAAEVADLERRAEPARRALKMRPGDIPPLPSNLRAELGESYDAHVKLFWNRQYRSMTNYDAHLDQSEGERHPETVLARKLLSKAERLRKANDYQALEYYDEAWPQWVQALLRHPEFAKISSVQEDVYEPQLKYTRLNQEARKEKWQEWRWLNASQAAKVAAMRTVRGPLESVVYYDGPEAEALRRFWFGLTYGAALAGRPGFAPPVPLPGQEKLALSGGTARGPDAQPPAGWRFLIEEDNIRTVRERLGMNR